MKTIESCTNSLHLRSMKKITRELRDEYFCSFDTRVFRELVSYLEIRVCFYGVASISS